MAEDKFEVVITATVFKGDAVLLTRRSLSKKRFPGKWTVPGGHLQLSDFANTPKATEYWYQVLEHALAREVREETGIAVEGADYILNLANVHGDDAVIILLCSSRYKSGDVTLNPNECDEYAWVEEKDLSKYDLIDGLDYEIRESFRRRKQ